MESKRVFVFPLKNSLLLPGAVLPLNIFESRYLQMLEDSIQSGTPIVVCPPPRVTPGLPPKLRYVQRYAAAGKPEVLQRRADGSCVILLHGTERVLLDEVTREKPYIECQAFSVRTQKHLEPGLIFKLNRLRSELLDWAEEHLLTPDFDLFAEASEGPETLVDMATAIFVTDMKTREKLLQEIDVNQRLLTVLEFLDSRPRSPDSTKSKEVSRK